MPAKLFGIADAHVHFLSDLASGGYMLWGKPFPASPATRGENAERECLWHCDGPGGHGPGGILPSLEGLGHLVGGLPRVRRLASTRHHGVPAGVHRLDTLGPVDRQEWLALVL